MNMSHLTQIYLLQLTHTLHSFLINFYTENKKYRENAKPYKLPTMQGVF